MSIIKSIKLRRENRMFKEKTQSKQLHFQSIKTRILALTLALLTAFTALPSQTAYAEGSGTVSGDGNSQGTGGSIGGAVGHKSGGFAKVNQGYRFYMVDKNFNRVTDVYDFVFSVPNAGAILTNSRFESISYSQSHWHLGSIDKLVNMAQGTQNASAITSIYPLTFNESTHDFEVYGSQFRQWFIGNGGGSIGTSHVDTTGGASSGGNAGSGNSGSTSHLVVAIQTKETQPRIQTIRTTIQHRRNLDVMFRNLQV